MPHWMTRENRVSFEEHVKTLASYLNHYKSSSRAEQVSSSQSFFSYLLTACWEKMHNRISAWSAVGLIFGLRSSLSSPLLETGIRRFSWDGVNEQQHTGDRTLALEINSARQTIMASIMKNNISQFRRIENLLAAIKTAVKEQKYGFYNQSTAREFHNLFTATFTGFAKALALVGKFRNKVRAVHVFMVMTFDTLLR